MNQSRRRYRDVTLAAHFSCVILMLIGLISCSTEVSEPAYFSRVQQPRAESGPSEMSKRRELINVIEKQRALIAQLKASSANTQSTTGSAPTTNKDLDLDRSSIEDLQSIVKVQQRLIDSLR